MFSISSKIDVPVMTNEGVKRALVSFPTDQQWAKRASSKKITQKNIGRGQTEVLPASYEHLDQALYEEIRAEGSPGLDEYEAAEVISRISEAEVMGAEYLGSSVEVALKTVAGDTTHKLRIPSARDKAQYGRALVTVRDLPFGRQQITITLNAAKALYDELIDTAEGYDALASVPIIHKAAVMSAVFQAIEDAIEGDGQAPNR